MRGGIEQPLMQGTARHAAFFDPEYSRRSGAANFQRDQILEGGAMEQRARVVGIGLVYQIGQRCKGGWL